MKSEVDASGKVVNANKVRDFESEAAVKQPFVCRATAGCHNHSQDGSDGGWGPACCL